MNAKSQNFKQFLGRLSDVVAMERDEYPFQSTYVSRQAAPCRCGLRH